MNLRTILHPTDFSTSSGQAFQLACSLARDHQARLVLLHVAPRPPIVLPADVITDRNYANYKQQLEVKLHQLKPEDPSIPVDYRLESGNADEVILRVAHELPSDVIVLGTHGTTGLMRALLGSVAEQVLRKAPCSVVVIKTPRDDPAGRPWGPVMPGTR